MLYVQDDSQWTNEQEFRSNSYNSWEDRLGSTECINRTVFVGALHGMMTAYALAKICQELFGDVEYAAIDTDRNKYPIGMMKKLESIEKAEQNICFKSSIFNKVLDVSCLSMLIVIMQLLQPII